LSKCKDLKTIKNLLETSIDEAIERKHLAMKAYFANLTTKNDLSNFVKQVRSILNSPLQ
jgi:hypothetical protein